MFHHESWKPIYFGVKRPKVKVTKHKDKSVSRFIIIIIIISLQAERNIIVAAYVSNAGFSLLQCPAAQAMLTIPGFPCVTSPLPVFHTWSFSQSASDKNIAGVGHINLVIAGSASSLNNCF